MRQQNQVKFAGELTPLGRKTKWVLCFYCTDLR